MEDEIKKEEHEKEESVKEGIVEETNKVEEHPTKHTPQEPTPTAYDLAHPKPKSHKTAIFIIVIILALAIGIYTMTGNTIDENMDLTSKDGINADSNTGSSSGNMDLTSKDGINVDSNTGSSSGNKVKLETSLGDIVINLYTDMPITTGNFKNLVEQGTYDGVIFHRIIEGFMIQGGEIKTQNIPNIEDEFTHAGGNKNTKYTISMANAGPNTGSSQFFINLVDNNFLDEKHPVFGLVIEGMDIVDKMAKVEKDANNKPLEEVTIIKASIIN